ncbi:MAG: dipeptidase [Planctomycetota bacterium]|jgi:acetylornithine deacetylase/succinyl-diaminopimelate desuccinylase-like protein
MIPAEISEYLESHRDEQLARLFELLRIASIANNDDGQCEVAAGWIADHLNQLGLTAEIVQTDGKPVVLGSLSISPDVPTLLIYAHYDVQPVEPLDAWETPPFAPAVRDGWIYARGADDDKGQLFAALMAIEAYQRCSGAAPVNLKLLIEGEEEIGSPNLEPFITARAAQLSADAALISDSAFFADGIPSLTYSLRGLTYVELELQGPAQDVHSGVYGGLVTNPANALAKMIAQMQDDNGRVTIDGFYDDVLPLSDAERTAWTALPFDEARLAAALGLETLGGGESDYSPLERNWARPTLDCNGIVGGYTAPGSKTIIPASAAAKISMRLVPQQDPEKIVAGFRRFVADHTPPGIKASVKVNASAKPVLLVTDSPAMTAGKDALREAFGSDVTLVRCGASVPVTELIQRILHLDAVMMGFGLPSDNLHSPNERFRVDQLFRGAHACAAFMHNLANIHRG